MTDQGALFLSISWKEIMGTLRVKCSNTTVYHRQANCLVEWIHRQLKASLCAVLEDDNKGGLKLPIIRRSMAW